MLTWSYIFLLYGSLHSIEMCNFFSTYCLSPLPLTNKNHRIYISWTVITIFRFSRPQIACITDKPGVTLLSFLTRTAAVTVPVTTVPSRVVGSPASPPPAPTRSCSPENVVHLVKVSQPIICRKYQLLLQFCIFKEHSVFRVWGGGG